MLKRCHRWFLLFFSNWQNAFYYIIWFYEIRTTKRLLKMSRTLYGLSCFYQCNDLHSRNMETNYTIDKPHWDLLFWYYITCHSTVPLKQTILIVICHVSWNSKYDTHALLYVFKCWNVVFWLILPLPNHCEVMLFLEHGVS